MAYAGNAMLKIKFHQPHHLKFKISLEFNHFYKQRIWRGCFRAIFDIFLIAIKRVLLDVFVDTFVSKKGAAGTIPSKDLPFKTFFNTFAFNFITS